MQNPDPHPPSGRVPSRSRPLATRPHRPRPAPSPTGGWWREPRWARPIVATGVALAFLLTSLVHASSDGGTFTYDKTEYGYHVVAGTEADLPDLFAVY